MQFQYLLGSFSVLGQCSQGLLSKFGRLRPEASRFRKFPFTNFTRFFSYIPIYSSMAVTSPNKRELSVCLYTCLNQIPTSPTKRRHSPGISKRILQPVPHSFSRAPQQRADLEHIRLASSTMVSGQSRDISSSRVTICPRCSNRICNNSNSFGGSGTGSPLRNRQNISRSIQ